MPKKRNENIIEQNTPAGEFKAIDFFCGGGGMTCGLRQAGIHVIAGVDFDKNARATYEYNNPGSVFIHEDITKLPLNYFAERFQIKRKDDNLILVGCSPCQYYSIINTDRTKSVKSRDLLIHFAKFIEYYRPGYVLVENVPGIVTNKESILPRFLEQLQKLGYAHIAKGVVDMSNYGIPQSRRRFSLIATRLNREISLPAKSEKILTVGDVLGEKNGFPQIVAGHKDSTPFAHTVAGLGKVCLQRLSYTPHNGGNRLSWANIPDLQLPCYRGKDDSFKDNYGRMWWNRPSPTITTKFFNISNGRFAHPDEDRAISIREGATLQTFPKNYVFKTNSIAAAARIIGNAVPCAYAKLLGLTILQ
ncbi:MAG: DNA cytosine methyltransferase [Paludibacteraceae bacterium]|nr:DNA cytosine methyltransferase [Paludibacteraceae bacterium]